MQEIELTQGFKAIVDDDDFVDVAQHLWHLQVTRRGENVYRYAFRRIKGQDGKIKIEYMHRFIMKPEDGMVVDHCSHDGLDNRRSNLRVCKESENLYNQGGRSSTGFKGVNRTGKKFRAQLVFNGKHIYSKPKDTAEEAARDYDELARKFHGKFAYLNFKDNQI